MWDLRTGRVARSLETRGTVTSIEVTAGGAHVVTADGKEVAVRDGASLEVVRTLATPGYEVESASYCHERGRVVAGGSDMWVHLYDAASGEEVDCSKGESVRGGGEGLGWGVGEWLLWLVWVVSGCGVAGNGWCLGGWWLVWVGGGWRWG